MPMDSVLFSCITETDSKGKQYQMPGKDNSEKQKDKKTKTPINSSFYKQVATHGCQNG